MSLDKYEWQIGGTLPVLDAHSAAKHSVLRSYVARYIDVLTANPHRDGLKLTLVDGFAGGGEYVYQGQPAPGSPMILLQEIACARARLTQARRKPFALDAEFLFVDQSPPNLAFLRDAIARSEHGTELDRSIHLLNSNFGAALPTIVDRIRARGRAHRSIFLLDQYGYSQVSFDLIRTILASLANPEIIITFNVDWLIDFLNENDAFLSAVKSVELGLNDIRAMLALKGQREARWLIQNFLYRHLMKQTGAPYYTCFFVKSPASHRSYWLVHISRHPKARDEMALRHWAMSNHFVHHGRPGLKMLGFQPERDIEQIPLDFDFDGVAEERSKAALLDELPPLIFDSAFRSGRPATLEHLFSRVCNETPATTELIGKVLVDLREQKEIEIITKEGRPKPRSDVIAWTDVIQPAAQRSLFSTVWPALGKSPV